MIIVSSINELRMDKGSVVTVGTFDGVHEGHRSILNSVLKKSKDKKANSTVVTFDPHPKEIVGKGDIRLINTLEERLNILGDIGIDAVVVVSFTYEFSRLTSREFYEKHIISNKNVTDVIVGYDHSFGKDRSSSITDLIRFGKEYKFDVEIIPPSSIDGEIVSSTKIRNLLDTGNVERAGKFLGQPYSFEGLVVKGDRRGSTLGFPTANIEVQSKKKIIPHNGVYCVGVEIGNEKYIGMMNIGLRPTFQSSQKRYLEANIFDFEKDIYDETIRVSFLKRIRSEKEFKTKEDLITQLQCDRSECQSYTAASQIS
ncbi:MAG: bifunctional riboflavin kinase/FAD synthetase [Ignavibacteriales bacterium]|nr:bifunctional riboflavin kinase/FAD synthetase [Ignavibacteriales bacterium]